MGSFKILFLFYVLKYILCACPPLPDAYNCSYPHGSCIVNGCVCQEIDGIMPLDADCPFVTDGIAILHNYGKGNCWVVIPLFRYRHDLITHNPAAHCILDVHLGPVGINQFGIKLGTWTDIIYYVPPIPGADCAAGVSTSTEFTESVWFNCSTHATEPVLVGFGDTFNLLIQNRQALNKEFTLQREFPECYGILQSEPLVCSEHGECFLNETCGCDANYTEDDCSIWECFNILFNETLVCNEHGNCTAFNNCTCEDGWIGNNCSVEDIIVPSITCWGVLSTNETVCNGHGNCTSFNNCTCEDGWNGNNCTTQEIISSTKYWIAAIPITIFFIIIFLIIIIIIMTSDGPQDKF